MPVISSNPPDDNRKPGSSEILKLIIAGAAIAAGSYLMKHIIREVLRDPYEVEVIDLEDEEDA